MKSARIPRLARYFPKHTGASGSNVSLVALADVSRTLIRIREAFLPSSRDALKSSLIKPRVMSPLRPRSAKSAKENRRLCCIIASQLPIPPRSASWHSFRNYKRYKAETFTVVSTAIGIQASVRSVLKTGIDLASRFNAKHLPSGPTRTQDDWLHI